MAKYFIKFADNEKGVKYLDCLNFIYFWFLSEDLIPDAKTLTHIEEVHKGNITSNITFGMHRLRVPGKKVIIEGYALTIKGHNLHYMCNDPIMIDWKFKEFEKKCKELQQSTREYETIITISRRYDRERGCPGTGWNSWTNGYMAVDFKYKIMRMSKKLVYDCNDDGYDYFKIPDGEDIHNYTPNISDLSSPYTSLHDQVIPYNKEAHKTLTAICEAGKNLGLQLDSMLTKREFLLSSMNNLLLPEKKEEGTIKIAAIEK